MTEPPDRHGRQTKAAFLRLITSYVRVRLAIQMGFEPTERTPPWSMARFGE